MNRIGRLDGYSRTLLTLSQHIHDVSKKYQALKKMEKAAIAVVKAN